VVSAGFCGASCCLEGLTIDTPAPPGGLIWNVFACCLENRTRTVRTSSWMEASVVTSEVRASWGDPTGGGMSASGTNVRASWFSDMSRRMWSMSCRSRSSFLTSFWTCWSRTSRIRRTRWIESSWGNASSWICGKAHVKSNTLMLETEWWTDGRTISDSNTASSAGSVEVLGLASDEAADDDDVTSKCVSVLRLSFDDPEALQLLHYRI